MVLQRKKNKLTKTGHENDQLEDKDFSATVLKMLKN